MSERNGPKRIFRLGDEIRITSGPFASFTGRITGINQAKAMLRVLVVIFGRAKPIALNSSAVEKQ